MQLLRGKGKKQSIIKKKLGQVKEEQEQFFS